VGVARLSITFFMHVRKARESGELAALEKA
jgi:hypothetical protein